ncbi:MAG: antiporter [Halieaceae bacterium]|nr:antiporter [Halieaceae bacterium]
MRGYAVVDIRQWDVEDTDFWDETGRAIADRNMWISIACLMAGYGVWLLWGILTVQMLNLGFEFSIYELFSLTAIAGLAGATLRIPSSFFVHLYGGRNTIFFTTALLIIPIVGAGIFLQHKDTPLWVFQLLALLSGLGGGNFASSVSNISLLFPRRMLDMALGLNVGLGSFGICLMQILIPLAMTFALLGSLGGDSMSLENTSGTMIGKISVGRSIWIQNGGYVWLLTLLPLLVVVWRSMNNIITAQVRTNIGHPLSGFLPMTGMLLIGMLTASLGLWLMLPETANGSGLNLPEELVLILVLAATVYLLKILPGHIHSNVLRHYRVFDNKHTWIMSLIYTMTFGSFIGFAAAFPLIIKVVFGFSHLIGSEGTLTHDTVNPNGPSALMYAWMGAFIGAFARPLGRWLATRIGGAMATQLACIIMLVSVVGAAHYMSAAYRSATPEQFFIPFLLLFLLLFAATGIGNGSTGRTITTLFSAEQAGPVLTWSSAIAAFGAFYIPQVFGGQIRDTAPLEHALYGFAFFYSICLIINWWVYLRKQSEFCNP